MKILIVFILLLFSSCMKADELLLGQETYHFQKYMCAGCKPYREDNPLIGYSTENYAFIAMKNSYDNDSIVIVRKFSWNYTGRIRPFIAAGFGTGYAQYAPATSIGNVTALGYMGFDWHPDRDKWGYVITVVPRKFVGIGLRFTIN